MFDILDGAAVDGLIKQIPQQIYCFVDDAERGGVIDYLDAVPAKVLCEKIQ